MDCRIIKKPGSNIGRDIDKLYEHILIGNLSELGGEINMNPVFLRSMFAKMAQRELRYPLANHTHGIESSDTFQTFNMTS